MNDNPGKVLASDVIGAWLTKDSCPHEGQIRIANLAYYLYETRGRQDGHDVEDWLLAEEQLQKGTDTSSRGTTDGPRENR